MKADGSSQFPADIGKLDGHRMKESIKRKETFGKLLGLR